MKRECVQVGIGRNAHFGCSECGWRFKSQDPIRGNSMEEMGRIYFAQRDRDFALHKCSDFPEK